MQRGSSHKLCLLKFAKQQILYVKVTCNSPTLVSAGLLYMELGPGVQLYSYMLIIYIFDIEKVIKVARMKVCLDVFGVDI